MCGEIREKRVESDAGVGGPESKGKGWGEKNKKSEEWSRIFLERAI